MGGFRNNAYDLHAIVVLLGKDKNIHKEAPDSERQFNKRFLKKMISKEKEANKFSQNYYNTTLNLPYTNMNKICQVKELEISEEFYYDYS